MIARRLTHLSEDCNRILLLASVLGREFALDALARLGGLSVDELLDQLDEAIAARVVSDVPGGAGRLRFSHVLIRDTLYDGLTTARRVRLHRLAAEALEDLYGDSLEGHEETPERVLALAQHWSRPAFPRARSPTTGAERSWPCASLPTTRPPRRSRAGSTSSARCPRAPPRRGGAASSR